MNVDNVYIADVYIVRSVDYDYDKEIDDDLDDELEEDTYKLCDVEVAFSKKALVKHTVINTFVDVSTGRDYRYGTTSNSGYRVGDMIIDGLVPYTDQINVENHHMSKRRVLEKYNEYARNSKTESREE